jgi:uncharacterized protein (TIGR02246 family)
MNSTLVAVMVLVVCTAANAATPALEQCRLRVMDYAYFWDQADEDGFADIFTENATLTLGGETFSGRDAIVNRMAANRGPTMRHLMSTVRITATADDAASGISYVTVFAAPPQDEALPEADGFALIGEYHDRFRITADGCRIAERSLVPVIRRRR